MGKAITAATGAHFDPFDAHENEIIFGAWYTGWRLLIPAMLMGVPLYFFKRAHIKPMVVLPLFLFVPISVFFVCVFGMGMTIDEARQKTWLFPYNENVRPCLTLP
jgi:hypothetical protein